MGWQLDTSSPLFQQLPDAQKQAYIKQFGNQMYDNEPTVPIGLQQEGATLQQTGASTALTQVEQQKQAQQVAANNWLNGTAQTLDKLSGGGKKPVDAQTYNHLLSGAPGILGQDDLDKSFRKYINTDNEWQYNTGQGIQARQQRAKILDPILGKVQDLESEYNAVDNKGYAADLTRLIPGLGAGQRRYQDDVKQFSESLPYMLTDKNLAAAGLNTQDIMALKSVLPNIYSSAADQQQAASALQKDILKLNGGQSTKDLKTPDTGVQLLQKLLGNATSDAKEDIKGISEGIPAAASTVSQGLMRGESLPQALSPVGNAAVQGIAQDYLKLFRNPLGEAHDHPLNTALDVLPFLKVGGVAKDLAVAGKAGKTAEAADTLATTNPALKTLNAGTTMLRGGGSKEYVARTAKFADSLPQSQVLNEEGILLKPSETARIKATQQALDKHGSSLENLYTKSSEVVTGTNIKEKLLTGLQTQGVPVQDAKKVVDRVGSDINDKGFFNLEKGESIVSMKQLWHAARWLEQYKPIIKGDPDATAYLKQNGGLMARLLRNELSTKVSDAKGHAARYGALRDYMDNGLKDPTGLEINKGITQSLASGAGKGAEAGLNVLYKLLGGKGLPQQ